MASSVAFKPIDPKRDEFRRYLERAGVIEALTKVVIRLVKERPQDPLEYLRTNLGDAKHGADDLSFLERELDEARTEIGRLRKIIENVNPEALLEESPNNASTPKSVGVMERELANELNSTDTSDTKEESEPNSSENVEIKIEETSVDSEN